MDDVVNEVMFEVWMEVVREKKMRRRKVIEKD